MRMYIPGRLSLADVPGVGISVPNTINGSRQAIPLYLEGYWSDRDPNYFSQITKGNEENDVIHASLRSSSGEKVTSPHVVATYGGRITTFPSYGSFEKKNGSRLVWQSTQGSTQVIGMKVGITGNFITGFRLNSLLVIAQVTSSRPARNGRWYQGSCAYGSAAGANGIGSWTINPDGGIGRMNGLHYDPNQKFSSREAALAYGYGLCEDWGWTWAPLAAWHMRNNPPSGGTTAGYAVTNEVPLPKGDRAFLLGETHLSWGVDPLLVGRQEPGPSYWRNWLIQHAYLDALQSIPSLNDNSISNALEIVGFIKSLVVDHKIEIPKRLQDAWLSYRYVYTTTKLDYEEAISFMRRYYDLDGLTKGFVCHGASRTAVRGVDVTCRCRFDVKSNELSTLDKIWRTLYTYGLQPNFYVVWDMIPYSFIADWFIPVGDTASALDAEVNLMRGQYDIKNVVFSLSYDNTVDDYLYHCYYRWRGKPLESLNQFYWFDRPRTSSKVQLYRVLDTASLIID